MLHTMEIPVYNDVNLEGVCDSIRVAYFNNIEMGFVYVKGIHFLSWGSLQQRVKIICDETTYQRFYSIMHSLRNEGGITALEKIEEGE